MPWFLGLSSPSVKGTSATTSGTTSLSRRLIPSCCMMQQLWTIIFKTTPVIPSSHPAVTEDVDPNRRFRCQPRALAPTTSTPLLSSHSMLEAILSYATMHMVFRRRSRAK